ncbi:hypothetical protein COO72_06350 [Bifidobacterium callitrichos]|nr:hypothetical protein COO72_06350 [Bifidobacterium callitrichos]
MIDINEASLNAGGPCQICFTRVGKQGAGDGWQTVNVSPTIGAASVSAFEGMQNGNVKYIRNSEFDPEDVSSRIVTELRNDGHNVFLTRIKYGLTDEMDRPRPALFAQGFAFPLDRFIADPQSVLNVEYANYAISPDQTKTAPIVALTRTAHAAFSLVSRRSPVESLASIGLNERQFSDLVLCTMITLFSRSKETLTIRCDCSENTIRAVMACLYAAVPPALRVKLTFSTYLTNPGMPTTIVFAHPSRSASRVFDLVTGETNVLTEGVRRRYGRYTFITYPVALLGDVRLDEYFTQLEGKVACLDNVATADLDMFQLAHELLADERSDKTSYTYEECSDRMATLLVFARLDRMNEYCERLIAGMLNEFLNNNYPINELLDEQLRVALGKAKTDELISAGERYAAKVITDKTPEDGARYLSEAYPDRTSQAFLRLRALLADSPSGQATLKSLYVDVVGAAVLAGASTGTVGPDQIAAYRDEAVVLTDQQAVERIVTESIERYLCRIVQPDEDPKTLVQQVGVVWNRVMPGTQLTAIPASVSATYWKLFTFKKCSFDLRQYAYLQGEYTGYKALRAAVGCWNAFSQRNLTALEQALHGYSVAAGVLEADKRAVLDRIVLGACVQHRSIYAQRQVDGREQNKGELASALELDVWLLLTDALLGSRQKAAEYMIAQRMLPTAEQGSFFDMVEESSLLRRDGELELFTDGFKQYMDGEQDRDRQQPAKDVLTDLNELAKIHAKEEKQRAKEEKQRAKEERKKSGGFLSRFNVSLPFIGGHGDDDGDDDDEEQSEAPERAPRMAVGSASQSRSPRSVRGGRR